MQVVSYKKNEQGQLVVTLDLASSTGSSFLQKEEVFGIPAYFIFSDDKEE